METHDDRFELLFNGLVDTVKELRDCFEQKDVNFEGYKAIQGKSKDIAEYARRIIIKCNLAIEICLENTRAPEICRESNIVQD